MLIDLEQIWMLNANGQSSRWVAKIIPIFLDFVTSANKLTVRGHSNLSTTEYIYSLQGNQIYAGDVIYRIVSLSSDRLVIEVGNDYFTYFSLKKNANKVDKSELFSTLTQQSEWKIGDDKITFTNFEENAQYAPIQTFYKLITQKDGRKLFGVYIIDYYAGHVFLSFLIDGEHHERTYEIISINHKAFSYKENGVNIIFDAECISQFDK